MFKKVLKKENKDTFREILEEHEQALFEDIQNIEKEYDSIIVKMLTGETSNYLTDLNINRAKLKVSCMHYVKFCLENDFTPRIP